MKRDYRPAAGWGAGVFFASLALFFAPGTALGEVAGSRHDFSALSALGTKGICSPCHVAHNAGTLSLWTSSRPLTAETSFYSQASNPNYIPYKTLLCYDCHDDMLTVSDQDPPSTVWPLLQQPQDIAFSKTASDAARWGTTTGGNAVGYYGMFNGAMPTGLVALPTAGHYWKSVPSGGPSYSRGDKIACSMCHDPHKKRINLTDNTNDVFFRTETSDGNNGTVTLGNGLKASPRSRTASAGGTGREMCASCHAYSDTGTPKRLWGVNLPRPPAVLNEHTSADTTTSCTNCHKHNKILVSCSDCHGYPPTTVGNGWDGPGDTDESYTGGAGAHLAHIKGAGKTSSDPTMYSFGCLGGACHPGGSHDQGGGFVIRANVQVAFSAAWNPNGVFIKYGNALDNRCTQLYCHSNGLVENGANPFDNGTGEAGRSGRGEFAESSGMATFYGTTPVSPVSGSGGGIATWGGSITCKGCHGKGSPNYLRDGGTLPGGSTANIAVSTPDYLNTGSQFIAADNVNGIYNVSGANTHFIHVYKIPYSNDGGCRCHGTEAPGVAPAKHVNRQNDITYCSNQCHNTTQSYTWGDKHGKIAGGNNCVWRCHGIQFSDTPGGRVNKSGFFADPYPGFMESGHGLPTGSYATGNASAKLACESCHLATDRLNINGPLETSYHYERMKNATGNPAAPLITNPYWLKGAYAADPDKLCADCHNGSTAVEAKNHTAQGMITYGEYSPDYDNPPGTWTTFTPNCTNCHDPHGETNWYMLYDARPERSSHGTLEVFSGPVIYKGSRFGVTRAQSDVYGFPPGPNYAANQTPVIMTGKTSSSDFVNAGNTGICQVCHTLTRYYRRDGSNPGGAHSSVLCTTCHKHTASYAVRCETCHGNPPHRGCDGIAGNEDDAPNVVGNGTNPIGTGSTPKPYDDGTWGYNVNGHGANGSRIPSLTPNLSCRACHDLELPSSPNTHFMCVDPPVVAPGVLNTRNYFGKAADTRNSNTSHLVAGYLAGANNPQSKQIGFDDYCYNTCHPAAARDDMRHGTPVGGIPDKIMQFNVANDTTDNPKQDRGADNVWTPWTIDDLTNVSGVNASPPTVRHHGVCVSCHNPHGTSTLQKTRLTNHMVVRNWQDTAMTTFCQSNCHIIP